MLLNTGLRIGEICSLELSDIELSERKGTVVVRSGKGVRYREIPINLDVRRALTVYFDERPDVDDEQVFLGQQRKGVQTGLQERAVWAVVRKYARLSELDGVTPHVLPHSFAKSLIANNVPLVTVQRLLGHRRLDSTSRYTQPSKRDLKVAVSRLELEEV